MPDYKRLVSYMYNYEDGVKRNNVGYARVEARNGQCKYTLHITAPSLNEKQLKAYIFRRNGDGIDGIFLGSFQIKKGMGDFKTITESIHIKNSPYGLDDMGGIVLYLTDRKYFATEWDSRPVTMAMVSRLENKEIKNQEPVKIDGDMKAANLAEVLTKPEKEETKDKADNIIFFKKEDSVKDKTHNKGEALNDLLTPNLKHVIDNTREELEGDLLSKELIQNNKDIFKKIDNRTVIDKDNYKEEAFRKVVDKEDSIKQATPVNQTDNEKEAVRKLVRDDEKKEIINEKAAGRASEAVNEIKEEVKEEGKGDSVSGAVFDDHPLAKQIYNSFPRMYPFEDNEIAWCARIEPKDIGLLPTDFWGLGNNSFLLHGYYSYRHLLFARTNDKNGYSYILGVPGIYHNREKFMAKMFGFENFKCAKRKPQRTGEFGYWYIPVTLN